ncbi:TIGR00341 family protein [Hymenobacter taeanensis]|uniref:TIGR00341 family protein n=1 Tax=Hymenobacter taeanensis TaxID=2735321 RepID=A0A6M6BLN5_9BACT|nr:MULTISPECIES: TIGR00341 family protein [Hymenobacter]QJX48748.1 TIGR00341 family protein [Hymenobacter taeanensis]UOQ81747.1 TIGR00341 family protein [Hymenobacter sp. 5414T-23]
MRYLSFLLRFLRHRFDLLEDTADPDVIEDSVESSTSFRGTNLWVLIFAILIASVGLNVNSTAVIIGAMLISPLMGPLVTLGYSAATNNPDLLRRAVKNLGLAIIISLMTSTLYFLLTPLRGAQSELLARTEPTIWDVLIALFGGLAGAVGLTRREKSNVIPGVAIATALMPPLCTTGYGLASGHWQYALGAFYLFSINCVFITLASFLVMRFLRLPPHRFQHEHEARRVRRLMLLAAAIIAAPSVWLGYRIVQRSVYEHAAEDFVKEQLDFPGTYVVTRQIDARRRRINVLLVGPTVDSARLRAASKELAKYRLMPTTLTVRQGLQAYDSLDAQTLRQNLLEDVRARQNQSELRSEAEIAHLQQLVASAKTALPTPEAMLREVQVEHPAVRRLALGQLMRPALLRDSLPADTVLVVSVESRGPVPVPERERLVQWLRARTNRKQVELLVLPPPTIQKLLPAKLLVPDKVVMPAKK